MASKGDPSIPFGYRRVITNKYKVTPGEPRTLEGRARKKLQLGLEAGHGCVLAHKEMLLVIAQLPKGWLQKECK